MKTDQYTEEELKHSRAYNEFMIPAQFGNSMCVTLEGLDGSYVSWAVWTLAVIKCPLRGPG